MRGGRNGERKRLLLQAAGRALSPYCGPLSREGGSRGREGRCWHGGGGLGTRPHRDVTEGGEPLAVPSPRARSSAGLWSASPKRAGRRCRFGHRPRGARSGARTARAGSVSRRPPIRFPCCRLPREVPPALTQRRTSPKAPELRPKLPRAHRLLSQRDPQAPERAPLSAQGRGLISATPGEALSPPPRPLLGCAVVPAAELGVSEQVSR